MHLIACRSCCCSVAARFSFLFIFVALFLCTFSALSPVRPCFYAAATDVAWYGIKWYGMEWGGNCNMVICMHMLEQRCK